MIADPLPGGWINAQIVALAHWADESADLRGRLLSDLLDGRLGAGRSEVGRIITGKIVTQVLGRLVAGHVESIVARLLQADPPEDALGFGAVADCAPAFAATIDPRRLRSLLRWFGSAKAVPPRRSWPVRVVLAGDDLDLHRVLIAELSAADVASNVVDTAVDAWLHNATRPVLTALASDLRRALPAGEQRARLEGTLAADDPAAREWITAHLVREPRKSSERKAVNATIEALRPGPVDAATVGWLVELLATPYTDAARRVAEALADQTLVTACARREVPVPDVIARIGRAVDRGEDAVLIEQLVEVLIRIDELRPLSAAEVEEVFALNKTRLSAIPTRRRPPTPADGAAAVRQALRLVETVRAGRLGADRTWALLQSLLTGPDVPVLGSKLKKAVAGTFVGLADRDARAPDRIEGLFATNGVSEGCGVPESVHEA
jgi:hypothetical protein